LRLLLGSLPRGPLRLPLRPGALTLDPSWNVKASRELLEQLEGLAGPGSIQIRYGPPPALSAVASLADGGPRP